MKKNKKTVDDAVYMLDKICYDMEEVFNCGDFVNEWDVEYKVMRMSPKEHIRLFEKMQGYIQKMRKEIEFLLNEETLCDQCNKRLTYTERNR